MTVATDCEKYLRERRLLLKQPLARANRTAGDNTLPDATITTESGLKITPPDAAVPDEARALVDRSVMLRPDVKITELLMEVDEWTGFTRHFTHLKTGDTTKDKTLLLTTILADGINLGLTKMAESCAGTTYAKLSWLQAWHIRDETYSTALAELVNAQFRQPFAANWGDGTTSSSDGQRFKAGSKAESTGRINPKYGGEPGRISTPTFPTSTHPSVPRWSMSGFGIRPTCLMACCITSRTYGLRSTTLTRRGLPIMSLA